MMNVCTHAGLRSKENRLFTPESMPEIEERPVGEGLRESGEGGESGGAGNRVFDRVFRVSMRPASTM